MSYKEIINKVFKDILLDLASFRVQLVYFSYLFNAIVLWGVIFHGLDYKALAISYGSLTMVYAFYFQSKQSQAVMENAKNSD